MFGDNDLAEPDPAGLVCVPFLSVPNQNSPCGKGLPSFPVSLPPPPPRPEWPLSSPLPSAHPVLALHLPAVVYEAFVGQLQH